MHNYHLLGAGSIGLTIASNMARAKPQVANELVLLLRNRGAMDSYKQFGYKVVAKTFQPGKVVETETPFWALYTQEAEYKFRNLIVTTKAHQTLEALEKHIDNISLDTNILFVQNGMGVIEQVLAKFWPNKDLRPNIYVSVNTHGAYSPRPFASNHVGIGTLKIAKYQDKPYVGNKSGDGAIQGPKIDLLDVLENSPNLNVQYVEYPTLLAAQLQKLVINCCINPLTTIVDCVNGEILQTEVVSKMIRKIVREARSVFALEYAHLRNKPEFDIIFDEERLLLAVYDVCRLTAKNSSSMREDVLNLKPTEIKYMNGFIADLAKKNGIGSPTNSLLIDMVQSKLQLERSREEAALAKVMGDMNKV